MLSISINAQSVFNLYTINQNIPINVILTNKTNQQIIETICKQKNYSPSSAECKYEINANNLLTSEKSKLLNLSKNGTLFECNLDDCNLGYFTGIGANYTVQKLISIL